MELNTRLQSLEDDNTEQLCTKPYRRGIKPSQNVPGSHSNETWKKYSLNPPETDKFDQKRPGSQSNETWKKYRFNPLEKDQFEPDLNQKIKVNQRESSLWSRPFSVDPHDLFAGRGSNSWDQFGLVSGIPNGGLDLNMIHHPIGLQGTFRPPINPSLNMGISRQRCRDFEAQGFCLRGDMCPMEHGMNRIVVEDVQSLSQFNLPASLPITNPSILPAGTGPSPATTTTTNTLSNTKNPHGKNTQNVDSSSNDADFYDPDQPLWDKDSHTRPAVPQSKKDSSLDPTLSGNHNPVPLNDTDNEVFESTTSKTQSTTKGGMVRKASQKAERTLFEAERTLFVNGIPRQKNKRELLIPHFERFGEVIDIYFPLRSTRAFVEFSKREEAEAALMAPDAVMGIRSIKLWWANHESKRKDGMQSTLQNDNRVKKETKKEPTTSKPSSSETIPKGGEGDGSKKRKRKKKKDPNAPKRAMSGSMFFSQLERENVKKDIPGIAFQEIGRVLCERWNKLSVEEKEPYEAKALADKKRYQDEMSTYKTQPTNLGNNPDTA